MSGEIRQRRAAYSAARSVLRLRRLLFCPARAVVKIEAVRQPAGSVEVSEYAHMQCEGGRSAAVLLAPHSVVRASRAAAGGRKKAARYRL